jgi:hypothetical protein
MVSSINPSPLYDASSGQFTQDGRHYIQSYYRHTPPCPTDDEFIELQKKTRSTEAFLQVNKYDFYEI